MPYQFPQNPFTFLRNWFMPLPNAAQAWQSAGGKAQHAFWLFAAPVHMQLGRESYFLTNPAPILAPKADAESIVLSLNQHFAELGYHFYLQKEVWYLGLDINPKIITTPIEKVINQDVAPYLPHGEGGLAWASLQNEIQMLLFSHPVNEVRESQGINMINSIWFYGLATT